MSTPRRRSFPPAVPPPSLPVSAQGYRTPMMRAANLPGMVSLATSDLFPEARPPAMRLGDDPCVIRDATEQALAEVDLSVIQPDESIDILCSEHGFAMMGGHAYAEMLRTVRDIVTRETGNEKVQLAFSSTWDTNEGRALAAEYGLDDHFDGRVKFFGPYDRGVPIETEIGTLYGIARAYNAKRIIYCHYDDPRDVPFHRLNGHVLNSFTMSFARLETRAIFHSNFPTASANIVPRALYESDFIQKKFVCGVVLRSAPGGIMGVSAASDLITLDREISRDLLRDYAKQIRLFGSIEECVAIMDGQRWLHDQHAGGLAACNLFFGPHDHLDLDRDYESLGNPALKAVLMNSAWRFAIRLPVPFVGADAEIAAELEREVATTPVRHAENLPASLELAYQIGGTRNGLIFDGSYGAINCSPEMAEHLLSLKDRVDADVDGGLMQKWLAQRNLAPAPAA